MLGEDLRHTCQNSLSQRGRKTKERGFNSFSYKKNPHKPKTKQKTKNPKTDLGKPAPRCLSALPARSQRKAAELATARQWFSHQWRALAEPGVGTPRAHGSQLHCWPGCAHWAPTSPPRYTDIPWDWDLQRLYFESLKDLYASVLLHSTGTKLPRSEEGSPELAVSMANLLQRHCCQQRQHEPPIPPGFRSRHQALALFSSASLTKPLSKA